MRRAVLVVVAVLLLAGCGSGTGATHVDPATVAPPRTLVLATLNIAPQGGEKADFEAAWGKLLGGPPELKLGEAFTRAARTSRSLDYLNDVKPWLGDSLSLIVTRAGRDDTDYALLAASNDDEAARKAIEKDLAGSGAESATYRDVDYRVMRDGTVNAVFGHFVIAGSEPTFKAIVDAVKDDDNMASSDQWKATVGNRGAGKTALAYLDVRGLIQSASSSLPGAQGLAVPLLLGMVKLNPFVATLDSQPDKLFVDVSSPGTPADPKGPAAASSPLLEKMPASAWFAAAVPDVGPSLGKLLASLDANPLLAGPVSRALASVKTRLGLDIPRDVIGAVRDVGVFAKGAQHKATLVVQTRRPRPIRAAVARLTRHLDVVAASSLGSVGLGATPLFGQAAAAIGQRPTVFVNFGRALKAAATSSQHRKDPHFQRALPKLEHIEYVATGARRDGGLDVIRTVIGIR